LPPKFPLHHSAKFTTYLHPHTLEGHLYRGYHSGFIEGSFCVRSEGLWQVSLVITCLFAVAVTFAGNLSLIEVEGSDSLFVGFEGCLPHKFHSVSALRA
jgi:hypothetical protein